MQKLELSTTRKVEYDPELISTFARMLYDKAVWITYTHMLSVALCGGLGAYWYTKDDAIGFFVGLSLGFVGYAIGHAKAFRYRLEAQIALCQVQIELNTRTSNQGHSEAENNDIQLTAQRRVSF